MKDFDIVYLKEDLPFEEIKGNLWLHDKVPKEGIKKGTEGAIVEIYTKPSLTYEVEFYNDKGKEIGLLTLEPHQIELRPL